MHDPHLRADERGGTDADDGHEPVLGNVEFRVLAEHAPIGIVLANRHLRIVFVNPRFREITGWTGSLPASTLDLAPVVHPDDRDRIAHLYQEARSGGTELEAEFRVLRPDGEERTVVIRGALVHAGGAADGRPDGVIGTLVDVTEQRRAEAERANEERRYRDLVTRSAVGQAVYDMDGVLVDVNRSWADLLGYEPAEVVGSRAIDHVHPDDRRALVRKVEDLVAGSIRLIENERRLLRRDGSSVWVASTITIERDLDGTPRHFHSIVVDIDERKRAELALHDHERQYAAVVSSMHDGLVVHDDAGVLLANASAARIMGLPEDQLSDGTLLARIEVCDAAGTPLALHERPSMIALREGRACHGVIQGIRALDGTLRWCLTNAVPLYHSGDDGPPYAVALMFSDITERQKAEDELRQSEERFRTLADALPVGVYHADATGDLLYVNPRWVEISGTGLDQAGDVKSLHRVHPDDLEAFRAELRRAFADHSPFHARYRLRSATGEERWVSSRGAAVFAPDGTTVEAFVGSIEDITPLVTAQEETHRLAGIVESTSDMVGIADQRTDTFVYLNAAAREAFGLVDVDVTTVRDSSFMTDETRRRMHDEILPVLRRGQNWSGELTMLGGDGQVIHVWQSMTPEIDGEGVLTHISSVGRDVTEQRREQEELVRRASHDDLTGLPNRTLLLEHLDAALAAAGDDDTHLALLFVDLDRFKHVNDSLGHTAGDALLVEAAERIRAVLRPTDIVARIGGDEFVILCLDVTDEKHAVACANRVSAALERAPFLLEGAEVSVTASIGIALSGPGKAERSATHPEAILRDADAAMYRAKDLGRARLEIFDEHMRARSAQRVHLTDQLTSGIESGAIEVHYQPCVDLRTGRVTSVEALARWRHPDRGVLGPKEFIELAEETGLIVGLGLVVLSKSCIQAREWERALGNAMPRVHVNLSARQLTASNLPDLVRGVLADTELTPHRLCLEITESVLMEDAEAVLDTLADLKAIGVSLAIDDFGTGYSSLSYLRRFPVDVLKVDHSFVDGLGPDAEDSAIVEAIVGLARTLQLEAIAEGVETEDQVRLLKKLGCGSAQGFYFARPAPPDAVTALLQDGFVL